MSRRATIAAIRCPLLLRCLLGCLFVVGGCQRGEQETVNEEPETLETPIVSSPPVMYTPEFAPSPASGFLGDTREIPTPTPVPLSGKLLGTKSTSGEGLRVLVDSIHANNFLDRGLIPEEYEYHKLHGPCRAIDYLRSRGVAFDEVSEGRLTPDLLADYDMLLLNLVSAERPPFYFSEIAALRSFIESGGGMFVFVDHSNAYFHAYRLAPLFEQLGLEVHLDTACDQPPHTLGEGNGWVAVTSFAQHPVVEGLECIGIQTGGAVDTPSSVAFTSELSWRDRWHCGMYGDKNAPGCFGNFTRDEDEELGPIGVVAAKQFGKGRIVIVGDQNVFGDVFINYADNYRLWLNTAAWLLDRPALNEVEPYLAWRPGRVMMYEQYTEAVFGTSDDSGFYHAGSLIGRYFWAFAGHRLDDPFDLLVFGHNSYELSPDELAAIVRQMRKGRNVLILQSSREEAGYNSGVAFQIFAALAEPAPQRFQDGRAMVITTADPAVGDIYILGTDFSRLDSGMLPKAEAAPSSFQQPMCDGLIEDIANAF